MLLHLCIWHLHMNFNFKRMFFLIMFNGSTCMFMYIYNGSQSYSTHYMFKTGPTFYPLMIFAWMRNINY